MERIRIQALFDDDRPCVPTSTDNQLNEKGLEITKEEIIHAIKAQLPVMTKMEAKA
ncbi:unnamed protein product [Ceutorhynchus assimilis]|uniref:Uncharacterized protein n=1 Tax=Ceutorhynchus assimilis TaxID=467358 RepID=A0A9N9QKK6_9CUCU|nr:unnamed protein product [Ceutorhynchus assimilis]